MKKKSQHSTGYIIVRDMWVIFRSLFWGIPTAVVVQLFRKLR